MCIFMALSRICWYNIVVYTSEELQILGQTSEGMKSKNVSQNSKIMFRTKITAKKQLAKVIVSVRYFKRRPINLEPNPLKEIYDMVC